MQEKEQCKLLQRIIDAELFVVNLKEAAAADLKQMAALKLAFLRSTNIDDWESAQHCFLQPTMAQWMIFNSFVNQMWLPLLCEKSEAMLLVLVSLTAGWWADEILIDWKILKLSTNCTVGIFTAFTKEYCYHSVTNAFQLVFQVRCIVVRSVVEV